MRIVDEPFKSAIIQDGVRQEFGGGGGDGCLRFEVACRLPCAPTNSRTARTAHLPPHAAKLALGCRVSTPDPSRSWLMRCDAVPDQIYPGRRGNPHRATAFPSAISNHPELRQGQSGLVLMLLPKSFCFDCPFALVHPELGMATSQGRKNCRSPPWMGLLLEWVLGTAPSSGLGGSAGTAAAVTRPRRRATSTTTEGDGLVCLPASAGPDMKILPNTPICICKATV